LVLDSVTSTHQCIRQPRKEEKEEKEKDEEKEKEKKLMRKDKQNGMENNVGTDTEQLVADKEGDDAGGYNVPGLEKFGSKEDTVMDAEPGEGAGTMGHEGLKV
jgi:hypothetical protein